MNDNQEIVRLLIGAEGIDINLQNQFDDIALFLASMKGLDLTDYKRTNSRGEKRKETSTRPRLLTILFTKLTGLADIPSRLRK